MIFLTLGTQLPFERLVMALDEIAPQIDMPIFGQIGTSTYQPRNFEAVDFMSPAQFSERFKQAQMIVSHAGIGTIISGIKAQKPLILMARRSDLGEHRNDHQLATVAQMQKIEGVHIVATAQDILSLLQTPDLTPIGRQASPARVQLVNQLRQKIFKTE